MVLAKICGCDEYVRGVAIVMQRAHHEMPQEICWDVCRFLKFGITRGLCAPT